MNRIIKFRVWDKEIKKFVNYHYFDVNGCLYFLDTNHVLYGDNSDHFDIQQFTGLCDINNKEIYEGDIIVCYPQNYELRHIRDNIYERLDDKPLPLLDIVVFKGIVEYVEPSFRVKVLNKNERGVASTGLDFYWNEVIGNIHENPELLKS